MKRLAQRVRWSHVRVDGIIVASRVVAGRVRPSSRSGWEPGNTGSAGVETSKGGWGSGVLKREFVPDQGVKAIVVPFSGNLGSAVTPRIPAGRSVFVGCRQ
jgi:hypothetical protein